MGDSSIEWTDKTWNPVRGCARVCSSGTSKSGCGDGTGGGCYAEEQAGRIVKMSRARGVPEGDGPYDGLVRLTAKGWRWTGETRFVAEHLAEPLRWREPKRVFVNSMSDLFHDGFTNEQIAAVFGVMAAASRHTFIVLTKRPARALAWCRWARGAFTVQQRGIASAPNTARALLDAAAEYLGTKDDRLNEAWRRLEGDAWPLPNVILGVSICNRADLAERAPLLREIPAAVRVWSVEPQLEDLGDVSEYLGNAKGCGWVLNGCESGDHARPMDVGWVRSLRDQCEAASVPFFLKQAVGVEESAAIKAGRIVEALIGGSGVRTGPGSHFKKGGVIGAPYLDGRQHLDFPEAP